MLCCNDRIRELKIGLLGVVTALLIAMPSDAPRAAAGVGDGTTSSSWMEDGRFLQALGAIRKNDFPQAIKLLQAMVAERPKSADAWNYLGFSLRKTGAYQKSEKAYLTALDLNPEHRGALAYLGELYLETDRREKAETLERKLTQLCKYGCPELHELRAALKGESANNTYGY